MKVTIYNNVYRPYCLNFPKFYFGFIYDDMFCIKIFNWVIEVQK